MIKGVNIAYEVDNKMVKSVPDLIELSLTTRTSLVLEDAGVRSTSQLLAKSEIDLIRHDGIGKKYISDIKEALEKHGLQLRDHYRRW